MNRGWWRLEIHAYVNGTKVDFEDELSPEVKRKIMRMVSAGCVAGEFEESADWKPMECEEDDNENIPLF